MKKRERLTVYDKYNGRCAYCGQKIALKDMQVDHIVPQRLGGENSLSNYNPACRLCNHYKRATGLEMWRNMFLGGLIERVRKIYIVKVAERYGMITFHDWDKKFYFEVKDEKEDFLQELKQKAKKWFDEYGVAESVTKDGKKYYSRRQVEIAFMQGYETAKEG